MSSSRTEILEVTVCFHDPAINQVFAELLKARGVAATIVSNLTNIAEHQRVITEPQFLEQLDKRCLSRCLVVGYRGSSSDLPYQALNQPLTESKIEHALASLLGGN